MGSERLGKCQALCKCWWLIKPLTSSEGQWEALVNFFNKRNKFCICPWIDLVFVFLQSSHLALIDTLMMAYTVEMVSVERVMSCISRYSSAEPAHSDGLIQGLPYDTEDAITTWINKVRAGDLFLWKNKTEQHQKGLCSCPKLDFFFSFFSFTTALCFHQVLVERVSCQLIHLFEQEK